jgi:hypothetical protein
MASVRSVWVVHNALCKKGFFCDPDGKHIRYFFQNNKTIRTMISQGNKNKILDAFLIAQMAKQLQLSKQQFLDFIDCRMSEEDYRQHLENNKKQ